MIRWTFWWLKKLSYTGVGWGIGEREREGIGCAQTRPINKPLTYKLISFFKSNFLLVYGCVVSWQNIPSKGLPQQAEVVQGVSGRLRPRIFLTFGTTRVVGRQPYALAAFTSGEILKAESSPGLMFLSLGTEKIPSDTTGNRSSD